MHAASGDRSFTCVRLQSRLLRAEQVASADRSMTPLDLQYTERKFLNWLTAYGRLLSKPTTSMWVALRIANSRSDLEVPKKALIRAPARTASSK